MSTHIRAGRHRSASRYSATAEFTAIARSVGENGARASAVLAASGGLVAAFALPAHAAASAPVADRALAAELPASTHAALVAAPAVVAPAAAAPVKTEVVGVAGVTAVAKPKPKPKPKPTPVVVQRAVQQRSQASTASRSTSRSTPPPPPPSNLPAATGAVGIAEKYIGVPYVYGGSSPSGFDCSGLTQYVFGQLGISLPRTASQQQASVTRVSNPQPGDLVFFGSPAYHVGIYAGNGMMIDSPKPGTSVRYRAVFSGVSGYGRP